MPGRMGASKPAKSGAAMMHRGCTGGGGRGAWLPREARVVHGSPGCLSVGCTGAPDLVDFRAVVCRGGFRAVNSFAIMVEVSLLHTIQAQYRHICFKWGCSGYIP
jgi:hypothetical protein